MGSGARGGRPSRPPPGPGLVVVWVRDCEKKNISIAGRAGPEDFGARDKGLELGPLKNSTNYIYIYIFTNKPDISEIDFFKN